MAEILGRLYEGVDTSMLTDVSDLTPLEQAEVTRLLAVEKLRALTEEARSSEGGYAAARYIVALEDGRVTTTGCTIFIRNEEGETNG